MLLLLACSADPSGGVVPDAEPPVETLFRFVVIADPHVTAPDSDNLARLDRAVDWIEDKAERRKLRLVLVVGDIGWDEGLGPARASLDRLTIPWIPINGDNEVQLGAEEAYDLAFADHYADLADTLESWEAGPVRVENPEVGVTSWFHNVAFTYEGLRFVGLDWASRVIDFLEGEMGELHDFEGGTWPFFEAQIADAADGPEERIVLFSHIPMHLSPGGFDLDQLARVAAVTAPVADHVWADLAGHYHASASETVDDAGYDLHITDATWDDTVELRIVEVRGNGERFAPVTELVVVP